MKSLITTVAAVAALSFATASFASPNRGTNLVHRYASHSNADKPYALTGDSETAKPRAINTRNQELVDRVIPGGRGNR